MDLASRIEIPGKCGCLTQLTHVVFGQSLRDAFRRESESLETLGGP